MLEAELIAFGLSPREAKVYMATLKLGEAPASAVAKQCSMRRLSTYSILERLRSRNFLTCYQNRRSRIYRVAEPEAFLKHCDDQISKICAKKDRFQKVLPRLKGSFLSPKAFNSAGGRTTRFIHDRALFENICVSALKDSLDWFVFHDGLMWRLLETLHHQAPIVPRLLVPFSQKHTLSKYAEGVRIHYIPDAQLNGAVNFMIIGSKVMFVLQDGEEFSAVEIDHPSIAQALKVFFLLLWNVKFFQV